MSPRVDVAADVRSARELVTLGSVRFGDADAQPEQVLRWIDQLEASANKSLISTCIPPFILGDRYGR